MTDNIVNTGIETPVQSQTPVVENTTVTTPTPVTEYEIDGLGKVKVEDIKAWKQGHMRQADYTRKTQEISKQKQEISQALEVYNYLKANPTVAQQLSSGQAINTQGTPLQNLNPVDSKINDVQLELATLKLDNELNRLKAEHGDFDEVAVLQFADKENISNIETAYYALKGQNSKNAEAEIAKRIKSELTEQIRQNGLQTTSIISTTDKPADTNFGLSAEEVVIAQKMGLTPEVYAKGKA